MLVLPMLLAIQALPSGSAVLPACRSGQLRLALDARGGEFNGMSHSGIELSVRNLGSDCVLAALPPNQLRDAHNRVVPALRQAPVGMHPGPVMVPVRLAGGHRAAAELHWVSGPVYPKSISIRAARLSVRIDRSGLTAPFKAILYGEAGKTISFSQTPFEATDVVAAGGQSNDDASDRLVAAGKRG